MQTLTQDLIAVNPKVFPSLVDEFRVNTLLMDLLPNDATAINGGNRWYYKYVKAKSNPVAIARAYGSNGTPSEYEKESKEAKLSILNAITEFDRAGVDIANPNFASLLEEHAYFNSRAIASKFNDLIINGDTGVDANAFDGVKALVDSTDTDYNSTNVIDLSSYQSIKDNAGEFDYLFTEYVGKLMNGGRKIHLTNSTMKTKIMQVAKELGKNNVSPIDIGTGARNVETYDGIPIIDLGEIDTGATTRDVVGTETRTVGGTEYTNLTDIVTVVADPFGFHTVTPAGSNILQIYAPDTESPDAKKKLEMEMLVGAVLKNSRGAGVFNNVKVA